MKDLSAQIKAQAEELRQRPSPSDEARRLILERNEALRKKSEAEYALKTAIERAEKAEEERDVLKRRPAVDEQKLAEMQTTLDGKSSQITRLQIRLSEAEKERDEKDVALRGALARAQAAETKAPMSRVVEREARVIPIQPIAAAPSFTALDHLDALVSEGLMTEAEAFARLRRAR